MLGTERARVENIDSATALRAGREKRFSRTQDKIREPFGGTKRGTGPTEKKDIQREGHRGTTQQNDIVENLEEHFRGGGASDVVLPESIPEHQETWNSTPSESTARVTRSIKTSSIRLT